MRRIGGEIDIIITFQTTPWSCDSGAEHSERSELCEGDSTWDGCQIGTRTDSYHPHIEICTGCGTISCVTDVYAVSAQPSLNLLFHMSARTTHPRHGLTSSHSHIVICGSCGTITWQLYPAASRLWTMAAGAAIVHGIDPHRVEVLICG
jgi:Fe2+ or Zn2+ uptake regulation protein